MLQYVKSLVVILLRERFRSMRNWKKSNLILIRKDGLFLRGEGAATPELAVRTEQYGKFSIVEL